MKKFKILALVMTCAILLSSFAIIPVSAETSISPADAELVYSVNFNGDTIFTPAAIGDGKATYTPSNDGTTLTINNADPEYTSTSTTRDYYGGVFNGLAFDSTTVYTMIYKVKHTTPSNKAHAAIGVGGVLTEGKFETYVDGTPSDTDSQLNVKYVGQYGTDVQARMVSARAQIISDTAITTDLKIDDGFITTKLVYDGSTGTISNYYLNTDSEWEKLSEGSFSATEDAMMSFVLYVCRPATINGTVIKDVQVYKKTVATPETPTAPNAVGKTVTIDGIGTEGVWANPTATYQLNYNVKSVDETGLTNATMDNNPSIVKITYDSEFLYVYHESTHEHYVNSPETTAQKAGFYFRLFQENGNFTSSTNDGKAIGIYVRSHDATLEKLKNNVNGYTVTQSQDDSFTYTSYIWNGTTCTTDGSTDLVDYVEYKQNTKFDSSSDYVKNTTVALAVTFKDGGAVKKSIEMKIPLNKDYKDALQTADGTTLQVQMFERARRWYGDDYAADTSNAGYVMISGTGNARSFKYAGTTATSLTLNLPTLNANSTVDPVVKLLGTQSKHNETDGTYNVRFVAIVNEYTGFSLNESKLGFVFNNGHVSDTRNCYKVYENLSYTKVDGSTGTLKASDFGGKYFFCFTIKGMDPVATYQFNIKSFTQATATADATNSADVNVKITYNSTQKTAVFMY